MEPSLNGWISLPEAYRRAKEVNSHKERQARSGLTGALSAGLIQCFSNEFIIRESHFCWVFPKARMPFRHKDKNFNKKVFPCFHEETRILEQKAWNIAYDEAHVIDESVFKHVGESEIFVYTGIDIADKSESRYSKIPMRDISDLRISDDKFGIEFNRFYKGDRWEDQPFSNYWRNEVYSSVSARSVYCLRIDVEIQFPYSIDRPKRKAPGRPSYREQSFVYLNEKYGSVSSLPTKTEMKDYLLERFGIDHPDGKEPSTSTCYQIISDWVRSRTTDSGN